MRTLLLLPLLLVGFFAASCGTQRGGSEDIYSVANIPPAQVHRCQIIVFASPHSDDFERVVLDGSEGRALRPKSFIVFDTMPGSHRVGWDLLGLHTRPFNMRLGQTRILAVMIPGRFQNQWGGTVVGRGQVAGLGEVQLVELSLEQAVAYQRSSEVYP